MIKRILDVLIIILFIGWLYMIVTDYVKVKNGEKAVFCLEHVIYDFIDGSAEECKALGYKVYYYDRDSLNVKTDFGPFWMEMKK